MNPDDVTELLRDMRHEAGISKSELARRLGWAHKTAPSLYEDGRHVPTLETVGRWAAACGFTAELTATRPGSSGRWTLTLNDKVTP